MEKPYFLICKVPIIGALGSRQPEEQTCIFQIKFSIDNSNLSLAVLGSVPHLGCWDTNGPVTAEYQGDNDTWQAKIKLPVNIDIEYKWILYDKYASQIIEYQPGMNRKLRVGTTPLLVQDVWYGGQIISGISIEELGRLVQRSSDGRGEYSKKLIECFMCTDRWNVLKEMVINNIGTAIKVGLVAMLVAFGLWLYQKFF